MTSCQKEKEVAVSFHDGTLTLIPQNANAVRVRFTRTGAPATQDELVFTAPTTPPDYTVSENADELTLTLKQISVTVNKKAETLCFKDHEGRVILQEQEGGRRLQASTVQGDPTFIAEQQFISPTDEYIFGTGQFQDGYLNIRGLSRRLTQVNMQISVPFILSNKGYGLLWHNYGLTDFNPIDSKVELTRIDGEQTIFVTTNRSPKKAEQTTKAATATIDIAQAGRYALLLDVGEMTQRHYINIDGENLVDRHNRWLPPTTSHIAELTQGKHKILVLGDNPEFYCQPVKEATTFRSPAAEAIDYTVIAGYGDEVIGSYRALSGGTPMMPLWALGYIHCRERFQTQEELLTTAHTFRERKLPMDLIVQDWLYWGKYGWNAMQFEEESYPDPAAMVKELHAIHARLMLSVWSKVDTICAVGKELTANNAYIPETPWVDFFNPDAAAIYWKNFNARLVQPYGIDAWWLDATEPENDDLHGRRLNKGSIAGDKMRNVYPLYVNKTVYEGLRSQSNERVMILTRSGFSGLQRYGAAVWSGDVGNDWETLQNQIAGGLNLIATGLPWWTYDAGGFFRTGESQYTDPAYHERFLRWFEAATFMPMLRVHGRSTNTEFWNFGDNVERIALKYLNLRYRMLPYIYSQAAAITFNGSTLMRPLVMDFPTDVKALEQKSEFMFGPALLVAPVVAAAQSQWPVYLPHNEAGWFDYWSGEHFDGAQTVNVPVDLETTPLFVRAGSIIPLGPEQQYTTEKPDAAWDIRIYGGTDAKFTVYEDDGTSYGYEQDKYSTYDLIWHEATQTLTITDKKGTFDGMNNTRELHIISTSGQEQTVSYAGKELKVVLFEE
ncbi:alpha-xylosidase [Bacteroidia bacterium]|nr:alpha-xylosidase [Bacteroidia bacterium]